MTVRRNANRELGNMYLLAANEPLGCRGCDHAIPESSLCISEIPEQIHKLDDVSVGAFRQFHLRCEECRSDVSCYQTHASRQAATIAQERTDCAYCGHPVPAGGLVLCDSFLVLNKGTRAHDTPSAEGLAGLLNVPLRGQVRFNELSASLRWRFRIAGLGNGRGIRTPAQAEQFYLRSLPASVRNLGEKAVGQFLNGKQASHVESVANAPGKAKALGNTVWEYAKSNTQRGSRNMTGVQKLGVNVRNGAHAARLVAKSAAVNAARGGALAAALEAPVSIAENTIHVMKGKKAKGDATKDVAKDVGKAGVAGGVVAGGMTVVAAMGAGPLITVAAPIVGTVGLGVFAFSSAWRIRRAIVGGPDGLSLSWVHLRFHAEHRDSEDGISCYDAFAAAVGSLHELEGGMLTEVTKQTFMARVWQEDDWHVAQAMGVDVVIPSHRDAAVYVRPGSGFPPSRE